MDSMGLFASRITQFKENQTLQQLNNTFSFMGGKMVVCGIEMDASEARLLLLSGSKVNFVHIDSRPKKLVLADDGNAEEVRASRDALFAFFRENNIELVVIKKRGTTGRFSAGSTGFKLEAIAQLYEACDVRIIPSQTIAAAIRRHLPTHPQELLKYQYAAFETAFSALP